VVLFGQQLLRSVESSFGGASVFKASLVRLLTEAGREAGKWQRMRGSFFSGVARSTIAPLGGELTEMMCGGLDVAAVGFNGAEDTRPQGQQNRKLAGFSGVFSQQGFVRGSWKTRVEFRRSTNYP